jgi:capsular polysaccharide biosynthesis protein
MEDEISLIEIATTLWKGKYVIIITTLIFTLVTALFSILAITPLYRSSAFIDPAPFGVKAETIIASYGCDDLACSALEFVVDNPDQALKTVSITLDGVLIAITVEQPSPHIAVTVADTVALALAENISIITQVRFEEQIESIRHSLAFYETQIKQLFGEIPEDPFNEDLLDDPVYLSLRQEQAVLTVSLYNTMLKSQRLSESVKKMDYAEVITYALPAREPFNLRWQLNTAVAAVFGLMLSTMIVFTTPFFHKIKLELQKSTR